MNPNIKKADAVEPIELLRVAAECLCGMAAIALATFVCFHFKVHLPTPSCSYFIIIVLLSLRGNLVSSIVVSLFAVGCLDYYFLPPLFSLNLADPRDIISAATFITAATVISSLVSRVRALMEEKLQRSESYLAEAQQLSHTGSFGWNVATGELIWSDETFRIFQCDPATRPTLEFILRRVHPEDIVFVKQTIEGVTREMKDFDFEHRLLMPDGSIKYLRVVAKPTQTKMRVLEFVGTVMDITERKKTEENLHDTRTVLEFVGAVMDITERKETEEILRETKAVLEFALKSGQIGDWDLDLVNDTSRRSLRHDQCFGYDEPIPEAEWGLEVFVKHLHPKDRARVEESLRGAIKNVEDWCSEFRVVWPDATVHWLAARGSIYRTREGKAARMLGIVMDITEKKSVEEALRSSEEKLEEAQRIAHVGHWERDLNTDLIIWSDETYRIYGRPPQESIHLSNVANWIHPEDREIMLRAVNGALKGERRYDVEYRVIRPNDEVRFVHSSGDVIKDEAGQPRRMFGTVQDITDRKRAEEALSASERLARGQLEALKTTLGALATESDPDNLPRHVVTMLLNQMGAHSATIWERKGDVLDLMAVIEKGRFKTRGEPGYFEGSLPIAEPAPPLWCEGILTAEHALIEDINKEPSRIILADGRTALWHPSDFTEIFADFKAYLAAQGVHALLMVPLIFGAKVAGIIGIRFTGAREFGSNEIELTKALAHQAMLAIQLMRLSQQSRTAAIIAERNRVARELHDTLLQGFTGIGLRLDALTNSLPSSLAATKEQLEKILEQSDEYLSEARRSVWQLRSPSLEIPGDFSEALKKVSERALQGAGIPLRFTTYGAAYKLAPEIEDNFLRICEEAVTNAVKHGNPTEVEVTLEYSPRELRLQIQDNGCGFDLDGPDGKKAGHFGLIGIRERTKRLAGNLSLSSQPGQGTEILVAVCPGPNAMPARDASRFANGDNDN
jgi:PAS domain S-box-containing protein